MTSQEQKPAEEAAPEQQTLEEQPLTSGRASESNQSYGSALFDHAKMFETPEEMDKKMPKKMRDCCNKWIVATNQFDEMENASGALTCARVLRLFLIFFIVTSTTGLIVGFILKASLAAPMEAEQYSSLPAPSLVVCASPWGSNFKGFELEAADFGLLPGNDFHGLNSSQYSISTFEPKGIGETANVLTSCKLVTLSDVKLKPLGKVAQYSAFETIRLTFKGASEDGSFNYGFCNADNEVPQRWYYGTLGTWTTGEIQYDQVNVGASDVSEGTPRSILNFKTAGTAHTGGSTTMEYFYGYFMVRVLSAQAKGLNMFAIVAFILLVAAAVNNCGLFELFFVEYIPEDEPPPSLVPNLLCQAICGKWLAACRLREKSTEEDAEAKADGDAEAAPESQKADAEKQDPQAPSATA